MRETGLALVHVIYLLSVTNFKFGSANVVKVSAGRLSIIQFGQWTQGRISIKPVCKEYDFPSNQFYFQMLIFPHLRWRALSEFSNEFESCNKISILSKNNSSLTQYNSQLYTPNVERNNAVHLSNFPLLVIFYEFPCVTANTRKIFLTIS